MRSGRSLALATDGGHGGATAGIRTLRATAVAGTMAVAATAWIGRDLSQLAAQPIVFGLAYLTFALAVAIRFGAIPLHTWSARLADAIPETSLPLVTAVGPAALAIVALAWADASIAPLLVDLGSVRAVVLVVAIASILLASIAAWIQDDIEHIVGYAIVGDAGIVLLAIAALDPAAWAPARTWILAFIVARSAFAAWAAATRASFGTGRVADLHGWAFRSPPLGIVLALIIVASIGLPGLAAAEARGELIALALDGPLALLVLVGTLGPLLYYGRLAAVGLDRPPAGTTRDATTDLATHRQRARPDRRASLGDAHLGRQPGRGSGRRAHRSSRCWPWPSRPARSGRSRRLPVCRPRRAAPRNRSRRRSRARRSTRGRRRSRTRRCHRGCPRTAVGDAAPPGPSAAPSAGAERLALAGAYSAGASTQRSTSRS